MKSFIKSLLAQAVSNDAVWAALDATVLKATRYAEWSRQTTVMDRVIDVCGQHIFPDLTIKHGVFEGMKYPTAQSFGSTLFPKLIGCYEKEIQPIIEAICSNSYDDIVNIGCGEGYYAVGLAMRLPFAKVYAYDTDEKAIQFCKRLAEVNNVGGQITTGGFCDTETLSSMSFQKALILSDCEGYEKQLFTEDIVPYLSDHDLLVEVHDFIDIEISSLLRKRFESSHVIEVIQSIDDVKKAQTYHYDELREYDLATRKVLLAERRPTIMEWFYMRSRMYLNIQHDFGSA
ncbi:MAG: methyltransferase [Pyrinomonadaceae bacterium]